MKLSGMMLVTVIVVVSFIYAINVQPVVIGDFGIGPYNVEVFGSYDEFVEFLRNNCQDTSYNSWICEDAVQITLFSSNSASAPRSLSYSKGEGGATVDYSDTNIQVDGVDEPDVVKTDGTYLYIVSNGKLFIIKAYPPEDAKVLSEITLKDDVYISNIFINKDCLIVFGTSTRYPIEYEQKSEYCYWWDSVSTTIVNIYDVSDRENPELVKDIEFDGRYFDSRMIDNWVYIIATESTGNIYRILDGNETINIPEITIDGDTKKIPADHIYYANTSDVMNTMTYVITIDVDEGEVNQKSFILGSSQDMYVSKDNIFLTYTHNQYRRIQPLIDLSYETNEEHTIIHKISIDAGDVAHIAQGNVPGRILNQFSMDEHNGFFRVATTIGHVWSHETKSSNNVYILDENLERVSEIENIAPGERIYSARFMGDKAYLVTFKKVDPFFTLDLSDPHNPKILGKLKIPGYSDYLHPYDENHIIGIGKDTVEALDELKESRGLDFTWYQGIKIALFDVSDFKNPKELAKIVIGDRGTNSPALRDHKAFLFDREKELLVIPVNLYEISDEIKEQNDAYTGNIRGQFTFQGAYVYQLNLDGFEYKGRITHMDDEDILKSGYYRGSSSAISRSLYIGDVLYTISDKMVKMNSLDDLSEINSVELV